MTPNILLSIEEALGRAKAALDHSIAEDLRQKGYTHAFQANGTLWPEEAARIIERKKFYTLDIGRGGGFMIEKATGEIFNTQGYGRPDYNKKKKADLGNILTADLSTLYRCRYNYLR